MQRCSSLWRLVLSMAMLALGGCTRSVPGETAVPTTVPTAAVTVTQGQIRDAITRLPVAGAQLKAGTVSALSDVDGAFSIPSLGSAAIEIMAPGYEKTQIQPRPGYPLVVDLVPGAAATLSIVYGFEKQHEFGREYDLLHPDVRALFSRDDFVRYMELYRPYDIVSYSVGSAVVQVSGTILNRAYDGIAQVAVQATVRVGQETTHRAWFGYAAKADGLWRWFRGSLLWPTPMPTTTATPVPTTTPWPTATPRPTLTPYPTPVASPTAYQPIVPGSQAVLIVDAAGLFGGPGENYPVAWGLTRGMVLLVLEWPRWVGGFPWYRVQVAGSDRGGWCKGSYIAPLVLMPTATIVGPPATPTPTSMAATPTSLPASGQSIAFTSDRDGNREIYAMNPDGTGPHNLTQHPAQDGDASWSPGHNRMTFVSDRNGNSDVFVMDADGRNIQPLTLEGHDQIHPAWSPSGAWIAYVSNEDGDWEIFVMTVNGSGAVQVTHNDAWDSYPSWAADSRRLVFTSARDGNFELYMYDMQTRVETRLTDNPASDAFPAWSTTRDEIAFTSGRDGRLELYLLDMTSVPQQVRRLTYTEPADAANRYPAWAPDGYWLAYTSWRDGNAEVYIINRDGWMRNVTNNPAADEAPAWAQ